LERKLASIQRILSVEPIDNADAIERITVLGWHCVAKKGEFKIGDFCVYCEIDTVLPDKPEFEFLKDRGFRIKTIRLRGQISQGICFPLNILEEQDTWQSIGKTAILREGDDVSDILCITKWEPKLPTSMSGIAKGHFPSFIPKTDETRIQSVPEVLKRHKGTECYYTEKVDGCSVTAWLKNGEFEVASRNIWMKETSENIFWRTIRTMDIENKLRYLYNGKDVALQGELLGEGIQGNKYKLKGNMILWFNCFDIGKYEYLDIINATYVTGLQIVPPLGNITLAHSVDELVELAKGKSKLADIHREGIVIRPCIEKTDYELGRLSFKVLNPDFLVKYDE
jgi:RNA ligase (TIGR02306 family)